MENQMRWILLAISFMVVVPGTYAGDPPSPEPPLTLVNVSSHCDWSWGHTRAWHEERYAETIRQVLLIMRDQPHYIWQLETENDELRPFLARAVRQWPEMVDEFWRRVREGRIEVITGITDPRLSEVYPETIIRNMVLGREYFARHGPGYDQKVYNAVDLMCGPTQMPQILTKAGYRYFVFSRPIGPQFPFWRKGLDGTRMLSVRSFYGYGIEGKYGQKVFGMASLPVWRQPLGGDDVLPDAKLAQEARSWDPNKKILTTVTRYCQEVDKYGGRLKEMEGVLDSLEGYIEAGLHGQRSLYLQNNQDEDLLLALEKAQVMAGKHGAFESEGLDGLWHDLLSCAGHAIQWCWAKDFDERLGFVRARRQRILAALARAQESLAAHIRFRPDLGTPVVVFNYHAWPVTGPVFFMERSGIPLLRDGEQRPVAVQYAGKLESGQDRYVFLARDVPACGYRTYYLSLKPGSGKEGRQPPQDIENEYYRVRMLADGKLEIRDKANNKLLGVAEQGGLGDVVFYDAPPPQGWMMNGPLGQRHGWQLSEKETVISSGPVYSILRAKGRIGPHEITREVRLVRGSRRLEFHLEIQADEGNGVFCIRFPLEVSGRVTAGVPFGAEPREHFESEPFRGEYFIKGYPEGYYATRWTDVSSDRSGYTMVCPWGAHSGYLYKPAEKALEFLLLRLRPMPSDVWGQASPSIKGTGRHEFDCSLIPHEGTWREAATYREALLAHQPLQARLVSGTPRSGQAGPIADLPDVNSVVEVSPAGMVLSAARLIRSRQGERPGLELRLYETLGRATDAVIRLDRPAGKVEETDFLGRPIKEPQQLEVKAKEIRLRVGPWKIVTLRLRDS